MYPTKMISAGGREIIEVTLGTACEVLLNSVSFASKTGGHQRVFVMGRWLEIRLLAEEAPAAPTINTMPHAIYYSRNDKSLHFQQRKET